MILEDILILLSLDTVLEGFELKSVCSMRGPNVHITAEVALLAI